MPDTTTRVRLKFSTPPNDVTYTLDLLPEPSSIAHAAKHPEVVPHAPRIPVDTRDMVIVLQDLRKVILEYEKTPDRPALKTVADELDQRLTSHATRRFLETAKRIGPQKEIDNILACAPRRARAIELLRRVAQSDFQTVQKSVQNKFLDVLGVRRLVEAYTRECRNTATRTAGIPRYLRYTEHGVRKIVFIDNDGDVLIAKTANRDSRTTYLKVLTLYRHTTSSSYSSERRNNAIQQFRSLRYQDSFSGASDVEMQDDMHWRCSR